jgi:hypothetical protein
MADFIQANHIQTGKGATRGLLKSLCLVCYVQDNDHERHRERFGASTTFLPGLENRHGLSVRTPHHERRSTLDKTYVDYFLRRLHSLSHDCPPEFVFNMGETCWRLFEAPRKVLAEKGCDTVKLESTTGEKTSFTALGAVSCAGEKLPLWVLTKGRTVHCEPKFGSHPKVILRHSESGWATENVIIEFIKWLHQEVADYKPCALVLDVYPSRRSEWVIAAAKENDVELLFVPAPGTGNFQPRDRRIFGELRYKTLGPTKNRRNIGCRVLGVDVDKS